jgi:Bifunctional DNA primase/polymerase, N-terminal
MSGTTLQAARKYTARGWRCIPVPHGAKIPVVKGWQDLRLEAEDLPAHFGNGDNIGLLNGEPSGNLVDVDCDAPEAVAAAPAFLPPTGRIHGRPGKRESHRWYVPSGPLKTEQFQFTEPRETDSEGKAKTSKTMMVELRSTGSQTEVPPSVHPSGETYSWTQWGDPGQVSAAELRQAVARLAACALIARHWPGTGSRHDAALALAGMLLRAGWTVEDTDHFIVTTARVAGDEEAEKRKYAAETKQKLDDGEEVTGAPKLMELLPNGEAVVKQVRDWLGLKAASGGQRGAQDPGTGSGGRGPSLATQLVELAGDAEFFHDPELTAWVTVPVGSHHETWPVRSRSFKLYLEHRLYQATERTANPTAMTEALGALEGRARYDGATERVWVRLAEHAGAIYLDLGDEAWRAVKITARGWDVIDHPPVRFRRAKGMLPLPLPIRGGSLEDLRPFVNVAPDKDEASDWKLVIGWLVAALHPATSPFPCPLLDLNGEHGSAKTTLARVLRACVDPSSAPVRAEPRELRDLAIAANNSWALAFDNLSSVPGWLSNALCRLSTGGGSAYRTHYENDEETIFHAQRPVILNGIEEVARIEDLVDRCLFVPLPTIPKKKRKTEAAFWRDFDQRHPAILGALLDAVAGALARLPATHLDELPRMADFALWVTAAEQALGWESGSFVRAYECNRAGANETVLESSPVAEALRKLMHERTEWDGTPAELLAALGALVSDQVARSQAWPKTPRGLSGALKRLAPNLRRVGIDAPPAAPTGHANTRILHIMRSANTGAQPLAPLAPLADPGTASAEARMVGANGSNPPPPNRSHNRSRVEPDTAWPANDANDANAKKLGR